VSPPEGEGFIGVGLIRTSEISYSWYTAPFQGISATFTTTVVLVKGWGTVLANVIQGESAGVKVVGPVGIYGLVAQFSQLGIIYFLQFMAVISINLAFLNILPIPALDGGKLVFLGIEKLRGKPLPPKIEQPITAFFFILLVAIVLFITLKDVQRLF
ncbi:site-2 protease family protein, partial [Patescibacteria group bacterium]